MRSEFTRLLVVILMAFGSRTITSDEQVRRREESRESETRASSFANDGVRDDSAVTGFRL